VSPKRRAALIVTGVLAGVAVVTFLLSAFIFRRYQIPSASMTPTVKPGEWIWTLPIAKGATVRAGDVVLHRPPPSLRAFKKLIARVVAVGGDTVEATGGHLVVNSRTENESYLGPGTMTPDLAKTAVPAGAVYVLGDNRTNSQGSRVFGPIPRGDLEERVVRIGDPAPAVLIVIEAALCLPLLVVLGGLRQRKDWSSA
jgi:signal peptidase I